MATSDTGVVIEPLENFIAVYINLNEIQLIFKYKILLLKICITVRTLLMTMDDLASDDQLSCHEVNKILMKIDNLASDDQLSCHEVNFKLFSECKDLPVTLN